MGILTQKTWFLPAEVEARVPVVIVTHGPEGRRITRSAGGRLERHRIPAARWRGRPRSDGRGDAFREGFLPECARACVGRGRETRERRGSARASNPRDPSLRATRLTTSLRATSAIRTRAVTPRPSRWSTTPCAAGCGRRCARRPVPETSDHICLLTSTIPRGLILNRSRDVRSMKPAFSPTVREGSRTLEAVDHGVLFRWNPTVTDALLASARRARRAGRSLAKRPVVRVRGRSSSAAAGSRCRRFL